MMVERLFSNLFIMALIMALLTYVSPNHAGADEVARDAKQAGNPAHILDGKQFEGQTGEKGKKAHHDDVLSFDKGRFTSIECFQYGFMDGPYTATIDSDAVHFKAETISKTHGKMEWSGTLKGDTLDVTYTWTSKRWFWTISRQYWFKGKLVRKKIGEK